MKKHYKQTRDERWKQTKPEELKIIDNGKPKGQESKDKPKAQEK